MTTDPVGAWGRLNAAVLMAITPEAKTIRAARANSPRAPVRTGPFAIRPEHRDIAGVRVRIATGGQADGPTLLMLCPLPQSILAFDPVWETLGARFNLVALDLPGFGRSEGGVEFMTFKAQGDYLAAFIAEMGLVDVHLVGPDIGMGAALYHAIHHEHRLKSLIIGDGPGIAPSKNGSVIERMVVSPFWRTVFRVAGAKAFVEAANRLAYVNYTPRPEEVADYVASYSDRIPAVLKWFSGYPESLASVDPHLAGLDLPVQVFWGDKDQLLYLDNGERLDTRLPRSRLHVFEACGHFSYQDRHEHFARLVTEWVGGGFTEV